MDVRLREILPTYILRVIENEGTKENREESITNSIQLQRNLKASEMYTISHSKRAFMGNNRTENYYKTNKYKLDQTFNDILQFYYKRVVFKIQQQMTTFCVLSCEHNLNTRFNL